MVVFWVSRGWHPTLCYGWKLYPIVGIPMKKARIQWKASEGFFRGSQPTPKVRCAKKPTPLPSVLPGINRCNQAHVTAVWAEEWTDPLRLSLDSYLSLSIQICPKERIITKILFWGWDWNPESYSREGSGFLGYYLICILGFLVKL